MKKIFFFLTFFAFTVCVSAQDTMNILPGAGATTVELNDNQVTIGQDTTIVIPVPDQFPSGGTWSDIIAWLIRNWDSLLGSLTAVVLALEIALSAIPTKKDYSILTKIRHFLDSARYLKWFTGNRASGGGTYVVNSTKEK